MSQLSSVLSRTNYFILTCVKRFLLTCIACLILSIHIGCTAQPDPLITTEISKPPAEESIPNHVPQVDQPLSHGSLTKDQIATLSSLKQVDDYPLYTMVNFGTYQQTNAAGKLDLPTKNKTVTSGMGADWACSLFAALGNENNQFFGRNFDWEYSPALLLFTDPPDGYASASMVDIAYLGFDVKEIGRLSELAPAELAPLLDAPNWPFDGMNERGLAIGMAAVPSGQMMSDPKKPTIGSLQVMRQVLDQAGDIEEALTILENYNIEFGGGPSLHYLIADSTGEAVLVEYFQGEMYIIPNDNPWHQATNFLLSAYDDPQKQCTRYDKISDIMRDTGGDITAQNAAKLLSSVAQNNTQWSVLYHMQSGVIEVILGRQFDRVHKFQLSP